jgi:hypothetical protein
LAVSPPSPTAHELDNQSSHRRWILDRARLGARRHAARRVGVARNDRDLRVSPCSTPAPALVPALRGESEIPRARTRRTFGICSTTTRCTRASPIASIASRQTSSRNFATRPTRPRARELATRD